MKNNDTPHPQDLTPEQKASVELSVQKTIRRIEKAKKILKRIKTPLIIAGAATAGFVLRGNLEPKDECPFDEYEDDEVNHDEFTNEQE